MATDILPPERKEKSAYAAAIRYATNVGTCPVVRSTSSRAAGASTRPSRFICRSLKPKRLELTRELVPRLSRIGLFHNMGNPVAPPQWEETKTAAQSWGIDAELLDVRSDEDIGHAFDRAKGRHVDALLVGLDGLIQAHRQMIASLATRNRLPAVYSGREFIEAGGLLSYAVSYPDL